MECENCGCQWEMRGTRTVEMVAVGNMWDRKMIPTLLDAQELFLKGWYFEVPLVQGFDLTVTLRFLRKAKKINQSKYPERKLLSGKHSASRSK
ncbi:hypothetical protein AVEN_154808-1 [Araneus ventricosus]|uniref:Uncharacterized protein n=1 Tax=Araneus ventricosus TaxID=182803 RepID=A0A4Y2BVU2_ARAVE|nr:hypothetical protein AVEN_154808-1 [Araneus ventricosus]